MTRRKGPPRSGKGRLRIVSGLARGRPLVVPKGRRVRPTPDRVREALFSILGEGCREARVVDVCAGTGALGLEALSRGAKELLLIERDPKVAQTVRENVERVGLEGVDVQIGDARAVLTQRAREGGAPFDVVLVDPPFDAGLALPITQTLVEQGLLAKSGVVVIERPSTAELETPPGLVLTDERRYGTVSIGLFELERNEVPAVGDDEQGC